MDNKTKIYLIRHGESQGNAKNLILGHTDLDLTDLGYLQARTTAEFLQKMPISAVYSSDLQRASNTARPHADMRGLNVNTSKALREIYCGEWEGMSVFDAISGYGDMYKLKWHKGFPTFVMPSGESVKAAGARFYDAVKEISAKNIGKTIVIVAHGGVIRAFWSIITKTPDEKVVEQIPFPSNASFSVLEYSADDDFTPIEYSHDSHLATVGITKING